MTPKILDSFKIYLTVNKFPVMYSKMDNGQYTKSFLKNNILDIQFISQDEYSFAFYYYLIS